MTAYKKPEKLTVGKYHIKYASVKSGAYGYYVVIGLPDGTERQSYGKKIAEFFRNNHVSGLDGMDVEIVQTGEYKGNPILDVVIPEPTPTPAPVAEKTTTPTPAVKKSIPPTPQKIYKHPQRGWEWIAPNQYMDQWGNVFRVD